MNQVRQGDVFLERVGAMPEGLKPVKRERGRVVLAHGEVTGHAHAIKERKVRLFGPDDAGDTYLQAEAACTVTHEEHATIPLEPGIYRVRRQREYSPEEIRRVAD
jgi:hypothetical protein